MIYKKETNRHKTKQNKTGTVNTESVDIASIKLWNF